MPFEKKKYKTAWDYKQKSIYLDENDPYQAECLKLLTLCGHKQSRFLGLLVHDLIQRNGINIESLDKDNFKDFMRILEFQIKTGMNLQFTPVANVAPIILYQTPVKKTVSGEEKDSGENKIFADGEEFISEEDMKDMNKALAAFGV